MKITIEFIPHLDQRYNTCGDWRLSPTGDIEIKVSEMTTINGAFIVAVHELVEALLCDFNGITPDIVDEFDIPYKDLDGEAGDDPKAPYHIQHCIATGVERILAPLLGVAWREYENELIDMTHAYAVVHGEAEGESKAEDE